MQKNIIILIFKFKDKNKIEKVKKGIAPRVLSVSVKEVKGWWWRGNARVPAVGSGERAVTGRHVEEHWSPAVGFPTTFFLFNFVKMVKRIALFILLAETRE